jgi:hypothetical protein
METFTEALSSQDNLSLSLIEKSVELYQEYEKSCELIPYVSIVDGLSSINKWSKQDLPVLFQQTEIGTSEEESDDGGIAPHPLVLADREIALQQIEAYIAELEIHTEQILKSTFEGPICPYEATLLEYLGPKFKCPTIHDLPFPLHFSAEEAVEEILTIGDQYHNQMITHLQMMSAEAVDTSFPGITSENLGNAFAVLSATDKGEEYVIDRNKTAQFLEFAEIVKNIPSDYIIENPVEVAQKLIHRYLEIHRS